MNTNNMLIGAGVLTAIGVALYMVKREQDTRKTEAESAADQAKSVATTLTIQEAQAQAADMAAKAAVQKAAIDTIKRKNAPVLQKYPPGTLIRVAGQSSVYQIDELGQRRWIVNRKIFDQMHLNMANVKSISGSDMERIPVGPSISTMPTVQGLGNVVHLLMR